MPPTKSDDSWTLEEVSATTDTVEYTIDELDPLVGYDIQVRAVNTNGAGRWSATSVGTTEAAPPGAPTGFSATAGDRSAELSWSAPGSDGGGAITRYQYRYSVDAGLSWNPDWSDIPDGDDTDTDAANETSHTLTGLTGGVVHTFQLRAVNAKGASAAAAATATPVSAPGAPTGFSATAGDRSAELSWSAPGSDGGGAITRYQYRYSVDAGLSWNPDWSDIPDGDDTDTDAANETSHTLTGLTNGTTYTIELRAVNSIGEGDQTQTTATPVSAPGAPTGFSATAGDRSAELSWSAPGSDGGGAITRYQYRYSVDAGLSWNPDWSDIPDGDDTDTDAANETSHTLTGLTGGVVHTFQLRAVNAKGASAAAAATATPVSAPGAPTGFSATAGDRSAELSWSAPGSDGGGAITRYQYRYSVDAGLSWNPDWSDIPDGDDTDTDAANETSHTLTGLTNGTTYTIELRAVNSIGEGDQTQTTATLATPPDPPNTFKAARGDRSVALLWQEPGSDGNSAVTRYQYRYSVDAGLSWNPDWSDIPDGDDTDTDAANETSHTLTGLTNGTTYTIELRAVNSIGESQAVQALATPVAPRRGTALVATDDEAYTRPNVPVIIPLLSNDASPPGKRLWITEVSDPANGTATRNADSTLVKYEPDPGFTGTDSFTYTFTDGSQSAMAAASVKVADVDPPVADRPTWEVRLSATEVTEGDFITLSAINTNQDAVLPTDHKFWVTIHIGRTESTADQEDFQVEDSSGAVSSGHDITSTKHHNGGWLYGVRTTAARTSDFARIRFNKNNDGHDTEVLTLWIYVNGILAGSEAITILTEE